MRVLHLYSGNLYGGIESMLAAFARVRVAELEHHFGLAWADGRLGAELSAELPGAVHGLGVARLRNPLSVRRARSSLRPVLEHLQPDAVICHSAWAHAMFAREVRAAERPILFWLHDAAGGSPLERLAARIRPDAAICTSAYVAETLPSLFPGLASTVIHPAVSRPEPAAGLARALLRGQAGVAEGETVLIQVARMEPWKGHSVLLDALGKLAQRPGWRCWMVGGAQRPSESRYQARLQERARRLGIGSRVTWLGERSDVRQLLAAGDLCVQPNRAPEPFGMAMVEALYAGRPVITADQGGAREVVGDDCGVRVPPNDPEALAAAIDGLLGEPRRLEALGAAGPARASALCDPAGRLAELVALLRPLVERRAA
jgi:glycosyltransferase involved in cell wall biosynthesis